MSIEVTRQILIAHGVGPGARVAVCFPFDPWAIGGVFRDAALACGASVLPLGLTAGEPSLWPMLLAFAPQVFCGSASLLIHWHNQMGGARESNSGTQKIIFHAGEPLRTGVRRACAEAWGAKVVNVYGMAEFDSVGSEGTSGPGLILSPHLRYALSEAGCGGLSPLEEGSVGELLISIDGRTDWYHTRDLINVVGRSGLNEALWPESWRVEHLSRTDNALKLPDGSLVSAEQVEEVARTFVGVEYVQLHLLPGTASCAARLIFKVAVCSGSATPHSFEVEEALLKNCLELADSVKHRAVSIEVSFVDASTLSRTRRGKVRVFVEQEKEQSYELIGSGN